MTNKNELKIPFNDLKELIVEYDNQDTIISEKLQKVQINGDTQKMINLIGLKVTTHSLLLNILQLIVHYGNHRQINEVNDYINKYYGIGGII